MAPRASVSVSHMSDMDTLGHVFDTWLERFLNIGHVPSTCPIRALAMSYLFDSKKHFSLLFSHFQLDWKSSYSLSLCRWRVKLRFEGIPNVFQMFDFFKKLDFYVYILFLLYIYIYKTCPPCPVFGVDVSRVGHSYFRVLRVRWRAVYLIGNKYHQRVYATEKQ